MYSRYAQDIIIHTDHNIVHKCLIQKSKHRTQHPPTYRCREVAQLSQRDRDAGCVIVFAKSRKLELGDNVTNITGLSSTTVT